MPVVEKTVGHILVVVWEFPFGAENSHTANYFPLPPSQFPTYSQLFPSISPTFVSHLQPTKATTNHARTASLVLLAEVDPLSANQWLVLIG
ncbi:hypothetical protein ElyMa_005800900 [Elysia marginata]|uniref:Uncharacterized protein n=1 Tax=Elysia marginata TaxID=1093978 RepID=A0AAV4FSI0_9GAST|nr:hypothetical protein ElyMa_005800900 [Elysia marginata]